MLSEVREDAQSSLACSSGFTPQCAGVEIGREAGVLVYGCRFQLFLGEARC